MLYLSLCTYTHSHTHNLEFVQRVVLVILVLLELLTHVQVSPLVEVLTQQLFQFQTPLLVQLIHAEAAVPVGNTGGTNTKCLKVIHIRAKCFSNDLFPLHYNSKEIQLFSVWFWAPVQFVILYVRRKKKVSLQWNFTSFSQIPSLFRR